MSEQPPPSTTPPPAATARANPGSGPGTESGPRPRIAIQYCTQCKWMLRAAYFAQELLSTFSTDLQEVSLVPSTGGIFTVTIYHTITQSHPETSQSHPDGGNQFQGQVTATQLWDRKTDGGFPEVKVLKSLVRNIVAPGRSLGHTDRALNKGQTGTSTSTPTPAAASTPATISTPATTSTSTATSTLTSSTVQGQGQGQGQGQADAGTKECEDCQ
ncbi:SelT/SelW/SelH family protein [Aspergillus melleus]|uniref:SelT/SelW/SelH family protein n=1 Tax=Aspergillus melleus TaxID=138277 RepID=UPI001E8D276F|nr:uncharacterized protein LDX57_009419 [Aspergillus melleus]KAH8431766.1 hypothetical protein LDX57_009419 [Aspergillus melleus]